MADELNKPSRGTGDWDIPVNENFDTLEAAARAFLPRGATQTLNVSNADVTDQIVSNSVDTSSILTQTLTVNNGLTVTRTEKTISNDRISNLTSGFIELSAESGSSDILERIPPGTDGQIVMLNSSGDDITVQDASNNTLNSPKFRLAGGSNKLLSKPADRLVLQYYSPNNNWHQISFSDNL
jgi:hypothetical protein